MIDVNAIRAEMARNKISQKEIAKLLGIATSTTWLKLNSKLDFTVNELVTLSNIFNKEINFFLNVKCRKTTKLKEKIKSL